MIEKFIKFLLDGCSDWSRTRSRLRFDIFIWFEVNFIGDIRFVKDMRAAHAMMGLFFDTGFLESVHGERFKRSVLVDQAERAQRLPNRRTQHSNTCRSPDLWKDWDHIRKGKDGELHNFDLDKYPKHWDCAIRPIIAKCKHYLIDYSQKVLTTSCSA